MLDDKHLKVLFYETNSSRIFPNTDIKGGVVITCRDAGKKFGATRTFTAFPELNSILDKVNPNATFSLASVIYTQTGLI